MQADVVGADIEQLGHLRLRQPDSLAVGAQLDAAGAILGGVEDQGIHALALALSNRQRRSRGNNV